MSVFEARAQPYDTASPLQPLLEFLRSTYFRVSPNDGPDLAGRQIADRLAELGPTFVADQPIVCDFLGIPVGNSLPYWLSPKTRHERLLDIVRHMVRLHGAMTSVIIIEDLHWLDEASREFIATLVEAVTATKTMLVVNCRPSYTADWMRASNYQQIELGELNPSVTQELVAELIGPHPELAETRDRVATRSNGNPFFAEELVRSLADHAALIGRQGDYRKGAVAITDMLPATVQAVIGARIDRLMPLEHDLLQVSAVFGKEFQSAILQSVSGLALDEVEAVTGSPLRSGASPFPRWA